MLTNTSFNSIARNLAVLIAAAGFLFAASPSDAGAQIRVEIPEIPFPLDRGMGAIMDIQSFTSGSGTSISMTVENGVTKIRAVEDGVKTTIEDDPNSGIIVKVTKQYGPEQMDILMEEYPDLYMSMKDFPEESEGAQVEVSLGITRNYEAADATELEEKHPEAFKLYKKYAAGGASNGMPSIRRFGGRIFDQPGIGLPEIRVIPGDAGQMEIVPGDIRIHDEDASESKDSDSSKKKAASDDKDT